MKKLKDAKTAVARIWKRIQGLGDATKPEAEAAQPAAAPAKPKGAKKGKAGAQAGKGAPAKGKAGKKATPAKPAPKGKKSAKEQEAAGPREGSKMAQAVALMQRKGPSWWWMAGSTTFRLPPLTAAPCDSIASPRARTKRSHPSAGRRYRDSAFPRIERRFSSPPRFDPAATSWWWITSGSATGVPISDSRAGAQCQAKGNE